MCTFDIPRQCRTHLRWDGQCYMRCAVNSVLSTAVKEFRKSFKMWQELLLVTTGRLFETQCITDMQDRQLHCARQLETCGRPLSRIKLKVFGNSGVGKTTLIECLKCGYLGGLLRSTFRPSNSTTDTPSSTYRSTSSSGMHIGITQVSVAICSTKIFISSRTKRPVHATGIVEWMCCVTWQLN